VLIVALVAFLAPLLLGLSPARRLPWVVIEIVAGIVIGPSVLGWVRIDLPISILSLIGLAFLLFLAGMEVELERLRGRLLLYVGGAFVASMGLALLVGYALFAAGQVRAPLFIAIILVATALGVVVPLLDDAGESATDFGQLVIAGAMFAEFGSIILLSLFFSREATGTATRVVLLIGFALLAAAFAFVMLRLGRSARIAAVLLRLQDTTAQLRVRGAFVLLVAFVTLASLLGLETILGAFVAGVILRFARSSKRSASASSSPSFSSPVASSSTWLRSSQAPRPSCACRSFWQRCSSCAVSRLSSTVRWSALAVPSSRGCCKQRHSRSSWPQRRSARCSA